MSHHGSPSWTPGTGTQSLSPGYYSGGTIAGDSDLKAQNIKSGVSIFGVAGSYGGGTPTLSKMFSFHISGSIHGIDWQSKKTFTVSADVGAWTCTWAVYVASTVGNCAAARTRVVCDGDTVISGPHYHGIWISPARNADAPGTGKDRNCAFQARAACDPGPGTSATFTGVCYSATVAQ
jgi:hypothetical protein